MMTDKQWEELQETGRCAAAALIEMVAALECDYDRLAELREELETFGDELGERRETLLEEREAFVDDCADVVDSILEGRPHDDDFAQATWAEIRHVWAIDNPAAAAELAELEAIAALEAAGQLAAVRERWAAENPDDGEELAELEAAAGDCEDSDAARERILEDPLSLRIFGERTDGEWEATEFELLLTTGGPAVRIMGDIDDGEPSSPRLEVQDWGTPWTHYGATISRDTLQAYCDCFYFGE